MPFTVTMPKLSPTMEEGTVVKWHKKEGDLVKAGDVMFEVATDKATLEHAAIDSGYLRKILVKEGSFAIVNQAVAIFTEKKDESIDSYTPEGSVQVAKQEEMKTEEKSPILAVPVKQSSPLSSMPTPKFIPEPPLEGNAWRFSLEQTFQAASPLAKKLARQKGIDLATVKGTGPGHRIMSRDLDLGQPEALVSFSTKIPPDIQPGSYEEASMTPMRKTIGQRLQASKTFIPHFYITQEVRVDKLVDMREQLKLLGHKISFNDFVIKACALSLRLHPKLNSGYNSESQSIIHFKTIDISIAVGLESGLITPIIRVADCKNLGQISQEMKYLAQRAKAGKLAKEEYAGGSFTVSNLGMFGVSEFVAIINPPQAAILAVGGIEERAVVEEGKIVAGQVMKVTLSADHRVVDGSDGAKFIKSVQQFLENPAALVM